MAVEKKSEDAKSNLSIIFTSVFICLSIFINFEFGNAGIKEKQANRSDVAMDAKESDPSITFV